MQKFWRHRFSKNTTAKLVHHALIEVELTIDHMKSISFEALVVFLREKSVLAAMRAALQRMHMLSTFRHGSPSKSLAPENVNVRVFLSAFMIAYRPTHVFESMGTLEQALFEASVPMLSQFEKMCKTLLAAPFKCFQMVPADQTKDFPTTLFEFLRRFKAWKVPDEAKLICRIKHALVALIQAEQHLPPDEPDDSKLKIEFREQITRLRGKFLQIAGQEALDKFDEDRLTGSFAVAVIQDGEGSSGGAYAALPGRMTNEQLAHELLLDPTFLLDESGGSNVGNPVFNRMRDSFHRAFWESLIDDLKLAVPCYVRVLRVLDEIRGGVLDLSGAREDGNITEIMDMDFIKARVDSGTYGFADAVVLVRSVVGVIQRVQAPMRDGETREKWAALGEKITATTPETQARMTCECLEFLLNRVNIMRVDAANARLRLISPVIRDHGIDYERGKFADKLNDGTVTLERTTAWMHKAMADKLDLAADARAGSRGAAMRIFAGAVVALFDNGVVLRAETIPETLLFDVSRLSVMQTRVKSLVCIEVVAAVVGLLTKDQGIIGRVSAVIEALEPGTVLDVTTLALPARIASRVSTAVRPEDAVSVAVRNQIYKLLRDCIVSGIIPVECSPRRAKLAKDVIRLAAINREVHGETYNKIMREFVAPA